MQETKETQVRFLSQEDPLEEGVTTHSSILPLARGAWLATVHRVTKSQTRVSRCTLFLQAFPAVTNRSRYLKQQSDAA